MNAKHFRIGNYISRLDLGNNSQRHEQILELRQENAITTGPIKVVVKYQDIDLIPLTEEWLLKFGFKVKAGGRYGNEYHLDNFILYTSEKKSICFVWDEFILDIYFVHDLQNLYNCLKKKELTIKTK